MKFALAVLFTLALALGVQSSVVPWGAWSNGWSHGAWDGPWHGDNGQWHGDWPGEDGQWHGDWSGHGAWNGGHGAWHGGHGAAVVVAGAPGPALVVSGAHAHVAAAPVVVAHPHHEGHYIAQTRGAVHAAPLAGHAASAASINLQPAPGTV